MKIADLADGMSNVSIEGKIIEISDTREVMTRYGKRRVASATIADDSGEAQLVLWENRIKEVSIGDKIKVDGVFITSFKDQIQINIPRKGKIEKL